MQSKASTVTEYLASLPEDRRKVISAIRKVIKANLDKKFGEGIQYGMIGYFVPHKLYPGGYHCAPEQPLPFASLASQKNHMAFYSFFLYQDNKELDQFVKEWKATGKKLDMGKSCIRFKKLEDIPLDVIGKAIKRQSVKKHIDDYEKALGPERLAAAQKKNAKKATKKAVVKKTPKKKAVAKKTTAKKAAKKATAKSTVKKKAPSKKASSRKVTAKKAVAKKTATKKPVARKKPVRKAFKRVGAKKVARKAPAKKR